MTSSPLVFLDIEASGLGPDSFPVEVGWAFLGGQSGHMLVKPAPQWHLDQWDPLAEAIHGLSIEALNDDGLDVEQIAKHLTTLFSFAIIVSDAPQMDGFWLRKIFNAAACTMSFGLTDLLDHAGRTYGRRALPILPVLQQPRPHRAEDDAVFLRTAWLMISAAEHDTLDVSRLASR